MAIRQRWITVKREEQAGPAGAALEDHPGAVHRVYAIEGNRLTPEVTIKIRVYADDQLLERWVSDSSGAPDYSQRPLSVYPEPIGEYSYTVAGRPALQILGLVGDPIEAPVGTPTPQRWSSLAQAYRFLHLLPEFASAEPV